MKLEDLRGSIVLRDEIGEPEPAELLNLKAGIELLMWHINNAGVIAVHFDIDCDGFSGGLVCYRALKKLLGGVSMSSKVHITTNDDRVHGLTQATADFCWERKVSLLVVVDSGSKLDYEMGCDVLVLDHHEFDGESKRKDKDGNRQIVVSNRKLDNIEPMSGCEVAYEFFRHLYRRMELELDTSLAQWVGVSLISDVVDTKTERNQFYVREAFEANKLINSDLRRICSDTDRYFKGIFRSYVTYKLAPLINAISRSGNSASLAFVISDNEAPRLPDWALAKRDEVCTEALTRAKIAGGVAFSNLTGVADAWRYTGVAASKLAGDTGRAALVFVKEDSGQVRGSFRKSLAGGDYLIEAKKHLTADGHAAAFGFNGTPEALKSYVKVLSELPVDVAVPQLTSEDIAGGKDLQDVALWNGRVNSEDEIYVVVNPSELTFVRQQGKVSHYNWRSSFSVKLLSKEFPQPPRLFPEYQRGISILLK